MGQQGVEEGTGIMGKEETLGCQKQIIKLITTKTKYYVITQKLHILSDLLSFIFSS